MDCLKEILCGNRTIIGIRDYSNCTEPESGLWLNDLPGISLKTAAKIANEEVSTGAELMKKCVNIGIKKVFNDFEREISPYFDFNAIVETRQIEDFRQAEILPAENLDRGLVLKRWRSELAEIYVEEIYIKSNTTATKEIKIYDGENLSVTYENVQLISGQVKTIRIDKRFKKETVKITMNNADVEVYSTGVTNWNLQGCLPCYGNKKGFVVKGWNGAEENNTMYGIGVKASVRCYNDNIMCSIIPKLYFAMWYKSGMEFMKEKINSDRLNSVTLFTKEKAKELHDEYEFDYKEQYSSTVKSIQAFLRNTKGECITCNTNYYAQITP